MLFLDSARSATWKLSKNLENDSSIDCDPKDEKSYQLTEDNQESLIGPPFKIFICKNDRVIHYDHIELWYDHDSLFVVEPTCLM
jgi:hypothetical protein